MTQNQISQTSGANLLANRNGAQCSIPVGHFAPFSGHALAPFQKNNGGKTCQKKQNSISSTSAAPARRCRSARRSTISSIEKPPESVTRNRTTVAACIPTVIYGSATATASAASTTLRVTHLLWISLSLTATAPLATTSRIPASLWTRSSLTACFWSSSLSDCMSSTRKPIPSFSFGRIIRKASPTEPSQESLVARRKPSRIR